MLEIKRIESKGNCECGGNLEWTDVAAGLIRMTNGERTSAARVWVYEFTCARCGKRELYAERIGSREGGQWRKMQSEKKFIAYFSGGLRLTQEEYDDMVKDI